MSIGNWILVISPRAASVRTCLGCALGWGGEELSAGMHHETAWFLPVGWVSVHVIIWLSPSLPLPTCQQSMGTLPCLSWGPWNWTTLHHPSGMWETLWHDLELFCLDLYISDTSWALGSCQLRALAQGREHGCSVHQTHQADTFLCPASGLRWVVGSREDLFLDTWPHPNSCPCFWVHLLPQTCCFSSGPGRLTLLCSPVIEHFYEFAIHVWVFSAAPFSFEFPLKLTSKNFSLARSVLPRCKECWTSSCLNREEEGEIQKKYMCYFFTNLYYLFEIKTMYFHLSVY